MSTNGSKHAKAETQLRLRRASWRERAGKKHLYVGAENGGGTDKEEQQRRRRAGHSSRDWPKITEKAPW
ncbi:hypothetical protein BCE02nite_00420 [Brevibacillus centrosporus]|nr:hypothetical protein BCE02nite_00420 [Brevibacillus centrosporus]